MIDKENVDIEMQKDVFALNLASADSFKHLRHCDRQSPMQQAMQLIYKSNKQDYQWDVEAIAKLERDLKIFTGRKYNDMLKYYNAFSQDRLAEMLRGLEK